MVETAEIVIIGGGAIGCSVAYNLARAGFKDIVLLEKRYLTSGSTGRCAASMRMQWGTELNCRLTKRSIRIFEILSRELDCEIDFQQSGYLLITFAEEEAQQLEKNLEVQHRFDIPSRKLTRAEAREMVPYLNTERLAGAFFGKDDGYACPFKTTFGYARAAERLGVEIRKFTEVTDLEERGGRINGVVTDQGKIAADIVINAAGPYAKFIGKMLGLSHPVEPERHQIMVTEPVEKLVGPMVMSFHHNSYIKQVPHGSFLLGYGDFAEDKKINYCHSWKFIEEMSRRALEQLPILKDLRVVRQWAGHYGISPDGQPILGEDPDVAGYYLALGCARGFMLAPVIGELMTRLISGEETFIPVERLGVERFARGDLIVEPAVV